MAETKQHARAERDASIAQHDALWAEFTEVVAADIVNRERAGELRNAMRDVRGEYFAGLPRPALSRCPFCRAPFHHSFDPWGVDGFWWAEEAARTTEEPGTCPHFGVLQGALDLQGKPPAGNIAYAAHVGPGVPFVIPRVLDQTGVVAVISSLPLANGYRAFPIVYFARDPLPPGSFTQRWTRSAYSWQAPNGSIVWRSDTDPWDFALESWVREDRVRWISPGDADLHVRSRRDGDCPYVGMQGVRERQVLQGEQLTTLPPPEGQRVDPFFE